MAALGFSGAGLWCTTFMKLVPTRRSDYAVRAMLYLAAHDGTPSKAEAISTFMDIPPAFVRQVLQALTRSGLVVSQSGRTGGYSLIRAPEAISLLEIIESLEGPLDGGECALRGGPCHWDDVCALHEVWSRSRNVFRQSLAATHLDEILAADRRLESGDYAPPADSHRRPIARG